MQRDMALRSISTEIFDLRHLLQFTSVRKHRYQVHSLLPLSHKPTTAPTQSEGIRGRTNDVILCSLMHGSKTPLNFGLTMNFPIEKPTNTRYFNVLTQYSNFKPRDLYSYTCWNQKTNMQNLHRQRQFFLYLSKLLHALQDSIYFASLPIYFIIYVQILRMIPTRLFTYFRHFPKG